MTLIKDCYGGRIHINNAYSETFVTSKEVRQRCILAPALFCIAIDRKTERVTNHQLPEHSFSDPDYVNNVALLKIPTKNLVGTLDYLEMIASQLGQTASTVLYCQITDWFFLGSCWFFLSRSWQVLMSHTEGTRCCIIFPYRKKYYCLLCLHFQRFLNRLSALHHSLERPTLYCPS